MDGEFEYVDDDMEPDPALNQWTNAVIGACIAVHRELGAGLPEEVYENALAIEFEHRGVPFERQKAFEVHYRGVRVGAGRVDFLIAGTVVLEIKSVAELAKVHTAQVVAYLRAMNHTLGLLVNFNVPILTDGVRRIANTRIKKSK
jgi:GxxExxY protein